MMINFAESGHRIFQATSLLGRGELKSKGGGKKTIHYNESEETVELILRTVICVNQLSFSGAVAHLCNGLDPDYAESEICESLVIPTESANANTTSQSSTSSAHGNLLQDYFKKFAELPEDQKLSKLYKDASSQLRKDLWLCRQHVENTLNFETSQHPDREGGFVQMRRSAQSWMRNSILTKDVVALIA